jgi:hypothetical protein
MNGITWMPVEADEPPCRPVPEHYYHDNEAGWLRSGPPLSGSTAA